DNHARDVWPHLCLSHLRTSSLPELYDGSQRGRGGLDSRSRAPPRPCLDAASPRAFGTKAVAIGAGPVMSGVWDRHPTQRAGNRRQDQTARTPEYPANRVRAADWDLAGPRAAVAVLRAR